MARWRELPTSRSAERIELQNRATVLLPSVLQEKFDVLDWKENVRVINVSHNDGEAALAVVEKDTIGESADGASAQVAMAFGQNVIEDDRRKGRGSGTALGEAFLDRDANPLAIGATEAGGARLFVEAISKTFELWEVSRDDLAKFLTGDCIEHISYVERDQRARREFAIGDRTEIKRSTPSRMVETTKSTPAWTPKAQLKGKNFCPNRAL